MRELPIGKNQYFCKFFTIITIELDDQRSEDDTDPTKGGEETDVRIWGGSNFAPHRQR